MGNWSANSIGRSIDREGDGNMELALNHLGHASQLLAETCGVAVSLMQVPKCISRLIDGFAKLKTRKVHQSISRAAVVVLN
jgi:hypothetical protein